MEPRSNSDRLARALRAVPLGRFGPALFAIVGVFIIGRRSFATDEAFSWGLVNVSTVDEFQQALRFTGGNMLPYFAVLRAFAEVSQNPVWLRIPSLLAAVATVALLARLGRQWFDPRTGMVAGLLAATSVPLMYYAVEARSYAFVALTATATWYFLEKAIRTDTKRSWVLLGLSVGLCVLSHLVNIFTVPWLFVLVFVYRRGSIAGLAVRLLPIAVFLLPAVGLVLAGDGSQTDWIPPISLSSLARAGRFLLGDHAQLTSEGSGLLIVVLYFLVFVLAAWSFVSNRAWNNMHEVLAASWFAALPVSLVAFSLVDPLLWHRYLIGALPGALLFASSYLAKNIDRRSTTFAIGLLVVLGLVRSLALSPHSADEYERLAGTIEELAEPTDSLVAMTRWERAGLDYYWRDGAPLRSEPSFGPQVDYGSGFVGLDWVEAGSRIWVVDRAFDGQTWVEMDRGPDSYDFTEAEQELPDGYVLENEFDVQRFRVRLYVPEGT